MPLPALSPEQTARYSDDRRPQLYGALSALLVVLNVAVVLRCIARYKTSHAGNRIALEDPFMILSGIAVNIIIGNLIAATHYGLGLHTWRILHEDPKMPTNLSNVFHHVWITMVMTGLVFTLIKLTLLFFYRRMFLVNQRWLKIAWWANFVYVILWFVGATGFYVFQCWPVQWYWKQYFHRYGADAPGDPVGACKATKVENVSMPLIFGLVSDVAILALPIASVWTLQLNLKKRLGIIAVFMLGAVACVLELIRIIQLRTNTDDKADPSYGVVIFLLLSAAEEVTAVVCACLPVIVPWAFRAFKRARGTQDLGAYYGPSSHSGSQQSRLKRSTKGGSQGFRELNGSHHEVLTKTSHSTHDDASATLKPSFEQRREDIAMGDMAPRDGEHAITVQTDVEVEYRDKGRKDSIWSH